MKFFTADTRRSPLPSHPRGRSVAVAGLFVLVLCAGCRSYEQDPYPGDEVAESVPAAGPYRLIPGDAVKLTFPYHAAHDTECAVRPDGRITVPFLGETQAAGRTLAEMLDEISPKISKFLKDANMTVSVCAFAPREVLVAGEVGSPGVIVVSDVRRFTLLDALMAAGGPTKDTADMSVVLLLRQGSDGQRRSWRVDMSGLLTANEPPQPVHLLPRDVIIVPNNGVDQVNVVVDKYITKNLQGLSLSSWWILLGSR